MIAALRRAAAYTGRLIEAATNARTLARTVRILARQLDNAHLLAASEEARADRAELRVAELEAETRDWAELSGDLAAEQPAADALPDLTDASEAPIQIEPPPDAYHERDRADRLQAMLQACEVDLVTARAQLQQTERAAGAHVATIERLRNELALAREHAADQHDWSTAAMGRETNHKRTIADLRKRLDDALRAVHKPAPVEQIPGVAAADEPPTCAACNKPALAGSERTGEAEAVLLCSFCHLQARAEEAKREDARRYDLEYDSARNVLPPRDADDPPPTRPSSATRTT
ncbi:MAG: hypothetical protein BWZ09_02354 [Alphaproteobacteria bacterium ADurb.BinA305]|nr:MAG: hypothetical protein BWZ09_02354 [Alphaproteobacteria bacterium ADurb.BinA305]